MGWVQSINYRLLIRATHLSLTLVLLNLTLHDLLSIALTPKVEVILSLKTIDHGDSPPVLLNILGVSAPLRLRNLGNERCELYTDISICPVNMSF